MKTTEFTFTGNIPGENEYAELTALSLKKNRASLAERKPFIKQVLSRVWKVVVFLSFAPALFYLGLISNFEREPWGKPAYFAGALLCGFRGLYHLYKALNPLKKLFFSDPRRGTPQDVFLVYLQRVLYGDDSINFSKKA